MPLQYYSKKNEKVFQTPETTGKIGGKHLMQTKRGAAALQNTFPSDSKTTEEKMFFSNEKIFRSKGNSPMQNSKSKNRLKREENIHQKGDTNPKKDRKPRTEEDGEEEDSLLALMYSKGRPKRKFVLIHFDLMYSPSTVQDAKKALIKSGLSPLVFAHTCIIDGGKKLEIGVDVKYLNDILERQNRFKMVAVKTNIYNPSNMNGYISFILGVIRRLKRSIKKGARSDRIKFLREWENLATSGEREVFITLFYNETGGVVVNQPHLN